MSTVLSSPASALPPVECSEIRTLISDGQLDTAEVLLDLVDQSCSDELQPRIDEARGNAAAALSSAQRIDTKAMSDETISDAERVLLLRAYAAVLAFDAANHDASVRLEALQITTAPSTTTTSTTIALSEQITRLDQLGLTTDAEALAKDAVAAGTLNADAADAVDKHSPFNRLQHFWWDNFDTLAIILLTCAGVSLVIIVCRKIVNGLDDNSGYRLVVTNAEGDDGPAFSASLRARLSTLNPWSGSRASNVLSTVGDLPSFAELGDHFKIVDWALKRFWRRRWVTLTPGLLPRDKRGRGAVLELSGATNERTVVHTAPAGAIDDDAAAAQRLVAPATAWLVWHWRRDINEPAGLGTDSWESLAYNMAGVEHLEAQRFVEAHACFVHACAYDPDNLVAQQNLLLATAAVAPQDIGALIAVADGLDDLIEHLETV